MAASEVLSRRSGGLPNGSSVKPFTPKLVGEGKTSARRDGGAFCASLFQIVLPHGNDALFDGPRPMPDPLGPHDAVSAPDEAVCEEVGERCSLMLFEGVRCNECWASFSHDVRRMGF